MCLLQISKYEKQEKGQYYNFYEPDADAGGITAVYIIRRITLSNAWNDGSH